MKLLMISGDRSILQGKRGAFWYTLEEFSKHWERIDAIVPNPQLPTSNSQPFPNVFFHPSRRGLWYQPWWILIKGDELINKHHHNVMTVHEYPPFYNGLGARWLHRATKIPYMTEIHHIVGYPHAANLIEWIGYWMSRIWLPRWGTSTAANVRVVSGEVSRTLKEWGVPKEKIVFLYSLYLDRETLVSDSSIQKRYDVVFCGRLVANKRLAEVLRAVVQIPEATLLVIGDGPERSVCEKLAASLHMKNRVTFIGWLPSQYDVYRAMQSGKIFIMNSASEGGPRVALEAMALGMPVISTTVGVMPEVIQDGINGVFTDGTVDGLRGKIHMMLEDQRMRESMGKEAMRIIEKFERKKLIDGYAEFLKDVMRVSAETPVSPLT